MSNTAKSQNKAPNLEEAREVYSAWLTSRLAVLQGDTSVGAAKAALYTGLRWTEVSAELNDFERLVVKQGARQALARAWGK